MTSLDYPPIAGQLAEAGGGSSSIAGWPPAAFGPWPYLPFAHPFAGWIALSDIIADSNPELGDAMRALAAILQAALEQSVADRFGEIRSALMEAGIPRWSIDDAERTLLSGLLPLSTQDLAEEAGQAFAELAETGSVESTQPVSAGFLAGVMHYGGHAILGLEVGQDAPPPSLPVAREDLPEGFGDYFLPATPLRVAASLDLPSVASGREFSIWCRKPFRRRGDNLVASEHTYIEREVNGLTNPRFEDSGAVTTEYRSDVEEWLPMEFSESIDLGRPLDEYYYVYELNDPKRSRAVRKMQKLLKSNDNKVRGALDTAATAAVTVGVAAAGPMAPALAPLAPLAQKAGSILLGGLISRLGTRVPARLFSLLRGPFA